MSDTRWIFAYGSLMWDPRIPVAEFVPASISDWQRSFCLRSILYRGTPERPGLVLGLDAAPGASCRGIALRVADTDWPDAIAAVRARELVTQAYRETEVEARLDDGRRVATITYVTWHEHVQYAGGLGLDEQAAIIASAAGKSGPNAAYLDEFVHHLDRMGLADPNFSTLQREVHALRRR